MHTKKQQILSFHQDFWSLNSTEKENTIKNQTNKTEIAVHWMRWHGERGRRRHVAENWGEQQKILLFLLQSTVVVVVVVVVEVLYCLKVSSTWVQQYSLYTCCAEHGRKLGQARKDPTAPALLNNLVQCTKHMCTWYNITIQALTYKLLQKSFEFWGLCCIPN